METYYPYLQKDISVVFYYFPTALLAGGIAWFLLVGILYRIIYGKWKMKKYIHVFLFVTYIVVVVQIAFLSRSPGSRTDVAFGLEDTWGTTVQEHAYVIENMLMFIHFGVIYPVFGKIATYSCIPIAICASALL